MSVSKYKRADGSTGYQVRTWIGGRKCYLGTFPTARDAKLAESEAIKGARAIQRNGLTLTQYVEVWLQDLHREPATLSDYRTSIAHAAEILGDVPLANIGELEMDTLVRRLSERHKPGTVRKIVQAVRRMLTAAQRMGYVDSVPSPASLPRIRTEPIVPLSHEQVRDLIAHAPDYWRPLFVLAATSGLRRGELLGLTWGDIDLESATLTVRQQVRYGKIAPLKTQAAHRKVHLPPEAIAALKAHNPPANALNLVFPYENGGTPSTSNVSATVFKPTFEAAGLPGAGLHLLRHTYASVLIRAGCSAKVVQVMLGHEDVTTTLNVYGHLFPDEWDKAANAVSEWYGTKPRNKKSSNTKRSRR